MFSQFITTNVWSALTDAARESKKPAQVAVAYFGSGAVKLLPLPAGSQLVVDASEAAIKNGQTSPAELLRMRRRKVNIYRAQNLHAKVFAFDDVLFIGSANASMRSANVLQEAVVRISGATIRRAARTFINELCLEELGPAELKRLKKLYRPPQFVPRKGTKNDSKRRFSALRVAHTRDIDTSTKLDLAFEIGRKEAIRKRQYETGFRIDEFRWPTPAPFRNGQLIVLVNENGRGRSVSPPGHVIHTHAYRERKKRHTLVYLEIPNLAPEPLSGFRKELKRILARGGLKGESASKKVLAFWKKKEETAR